MSWHIREAVRQLAAGGIIAYPTETVYGLGCDPFDDTAVLRLLALKQRDIKQGLILVADSIHQLEPLLQPVTPAVRKRVMASWPGPVTWLLPCIPEIPVWLRGVHRSLAVRVTSHPLAAELCRHWGGPLVSTSANIHGRPPATTPLAIRKVFDDRLDYILHGPTGAGKKPSEIRDAITGDIIR